MGRKGQQSVRKFTDEERKLVDVAMRIDAMDSDAQWVTRAAVMWARKVIADDAGLLRKINEIVQSRTED
jgi:hypothetical protein